MKVCRSVSRRPPRILLSAPATRLKPDADQPERTAGAGQQHPQEASVQQRAEVLGRVQEVQRRAGRRGVDHDQVPGCRSPPPRRAADRASPSPCTPGCRRTGTTGPRRTGSPGSSRPSRASSGRARPRRRSASCPASSRRGCRRCRCRVRGPGAGCCRARATPRDWASRRAGSMVSTTTLRPASAARRASAAALVVLPTPPAPQTTTIRIRWSAIRPSTSRKSGTGTVVATGGGTVTVPEALSVERLIAAAPARSGRGSWSAMANTAFSSMPAGVEGDLGHRLAEPVQHGAPAAVVQRAGGLDRELPGQRLVVGFLEAGDGQASRCRRRTSAALHRSAASSGPCWRSPRRPRSGSASAARSPPRSRSPACPPAA